MNFFLRIKKMIKKLFILILFIPLFSCQSVKDALTGKKYESSDEFLVIKKNPLVLPPDFNELPSPEDAKKKSRDETIESEIEDILSAIKSNQSSGDKIKIPSDMSSTEEFVLDQIKN
tara:strand:- start:234 stop:584 length:351 start_codon:yes stop_codon:yes gene_type:complete